MKVPLVLLDLLGEHVKIEHAVRKRVEEIFVVGNHDDLSGGDGVMVRWWKRI
jgi:hypothetical protein